MYYVIYIGCHKIHSLHSQRCQSLCSLYKKTNELAKLYYQVRNRTSILENCLIKRGCKLWNSDHAKHRDSTSKKKYNTVKVKLIEKFYELFLENRDTKFEVSRDLKVHYRVLPIRYFVDSKLLCYFWRPSQNSLPAFKTVSIPTITLSENKRTRNEITIELAAL